MSRGECWRVCGPGDPCPGAGLFSVQGQGRTLSGPASYSARAAECIFLLSSAAWPTPHTLLEMPGLPVPYTRQLIDLESTERRADDQQRTPSAQGAPHRRGHEDTRGQNAGRDGAAQPGRRDLLITLHTAIQYSSDSKLFLLPPQPPYIKRTHFPLERSKYHRGITARQGPVSASWEQTAVWKRSECQQGPGSSSRGSQSYRPARGEGPGDA